MGRRIVAFVLDGLLALVVFGAMLGQGLTQTTYPTAFTTETRCEIILDAGDFCVPIENVAYVAEIEAFATASLAVLGLWLVNTLLLPAFAGFSIGKLLTGIRIVKKKDASRPGLLRAIVRWLLWIIDGIPGLPIVGVLTAAFTTHHQRVGDFAAGTAVVSAKSLKEPPPAPATEPLFAPVEVAGAPPAPTGPPAPAVAPAPDSSLVEETTPPPPAGPPSTFTPPPPTGTTPPPPSGTTPPPPTGEPASTTPPPAEAPEWATAQVPKPERGDPFGAYIPQPVEDNPFAADPEPEAVIEPEPVAEPEPQPAPEPEPVVEPEPEPGPEPEAEPEPEPESEAAATTQPGVGSPTWDAARNTYIQWDPELLEWMEWSTEQTRWIPISR